MSSHASLKLPAPEGASCAPLSSWTQVTGGLQGQSWYCVNAWIQFGKPSCWTDREHGAQMPKRFCDVSGLLFPACCVASWTQHVRETGHEHLQSTVSDLVNLPTAFGKLV